MSKENNFHGPNVLVMTEVPPAYKKVLWPELHQKSGTEIVSTPTGTFTYDHDSKKVSEVVVRSKETETNPIKGITIVVPIHDEAKNIETFLSNLALSQMPTDSEIHFLFVVNGCTDDSLEETKRGLGIMTQSESEEHTTEFLGICLEKDNGLRSTVHAFGSGNRKYLVIETSTGSKANALNVANDYALNMGHEICMNLDANNLVEPDTIMNVLRLTESEVVRGNKFFVDAHPISQRKENSAGTAEKYLSALAGINPDKINVHELKVTSISGWCVAWNPAKLDSLGGIPHKGGDDYALGVICRAMGYEDVNVHADSRVWGFAPSVKDRFRGASRWARERLQLIDYADENLNPFVAQNVRSILASERNMGKSIVEKVFSLAKDVKSTPTKAHKTIARFVIQEIGSYFGQKEYRKNPLRKSWTPLESTK